MHHHYKDILDRVDGAPRWWDENAVPRFCDFDPREVADIYCDEALLLEIECQQCGRPFKVAMTSSVMQRTRWAMEAEGETGSVNFKDAARASTLAGRVVNRTLHYGDPPNYECCPAGATMNSVPIRVLEFWANPSGSVRFERMLSLERDINPAWKDK